MRVALVLALADAKVLAKTLALERVLTHAQEVVLATATILAVVDVDLRIVIKLTYSNDFEKKLLRLMNCYNYKTDQYA